jgi:hypothetical protein
MGWIRQRQEKSHLLLRTEKDLLLHGRRTHSLRNYKTEHRRGYGFAIG